jgi:hypothetical protein
MSIGKPDVEVLAKAEYMGVKVELIRFNRIPEPFIDHDYVTPESYSGISKCGPVSDDDNCNWIAEEGGW